MVSILSLPSRSNSSSSTHSACSWEQRQHELSHHSTFDIRDMAISIVVNDTTTSPSPATTTTTNHHPKTASTAAVAATSTTHSVPATIMRTASSSSSASSSSTLQFEKTPPARTKSGLLQFLMFSDERKQSQRISGRDRKKSRSLRVSKHEAQRVADDAIQFSKLQKILRAQRCVTDETLRLNYHTLLRERLNEMDDQEEEKEKELEREREEEKERERQREEEMGEFDLDDEKEPCLDDVLGVAEEEDGEEQSEQPQDDEEETGEDAGSPVSPKRRGRLGENRPTGGMHPSPLRPSHRNHLNCKGSQNKGNKSHNHHHDDDKNEKLQLQKQQLRWLLWTASNEDISKLLLPNDPSDRGVGKTKRVSSSSMKKEKKEATSSS